MSSILTTVKTFTSLPSKRKKKTKKKKCKTKKKRNGETHVQVAEYLKQQRIPCTLFSDDYVV